MHINFHAVVLWIQCCTQKENSVDVAVIYKAADLTGNMMTCCFIVENTLAPTSEKHNLPYIVQYHLIVILH